MFWNFKLVTPGPQEDARGREVLPLRPLPLLFDLSAAPRISHAHSHRPKTVSGQTIFTSLDLCITECRFDQKI